MSIDRRALLKAGAAVSAAAAMSNVARADVRLIRDRARGVVLKW